jgi:hypothetical protein
VLTNFAPASPSLPNLDLLIGGRREQRGIITDHTRLATATKKIHQESLHDHVYMDTPRSKINAIWCLPQSKPNTLTVFVAGGTREAMASPHDVKATTLSCQAKVQERAFSTKQRQPTHPSTMW